jgi:hypothetical protein
MRLIALHNASFFEISEQIIYNERTALQGIPNAGRIYMVKTNETKI